METDVLVLLAPTSYQNHKRSDYWLVRNRGRISGNNLPVIVYIDASSALLALSRLVHGFVRTARIRPAAASAEFQRSRVLVGALEEAAARGYSRTSVAAIVARAGVSRRTFYELFESREACFRELFEEAVTQIADLLAPLYVEAEGEWSERVRAALDGLLAFLERDRDVGAFVLEYIVEGARENSNSRVWLLQRLQSVVDDGRSQAKARNEVSPLTAEVVVGGVLAVLHARLQERAGHLTALVNPLMWMIVSPYIGPVAAARELQPTLPGPKAKRATSVRGPLEGLDMRVTYRTARVLAAIAEKSGLSNVAIGTEVEVSDAGQMSKLLARLEGFGLVENRGAGHAFGASNAWHLTPRGVEVDAAIRHQFATGERSGSAHAS